MGSSWVSRTGSGAVFAGLTPMALRATIAVTMLVLVMSSTVRSQGLGGAPTSKRVELGVGVRFIHRTVHYDDDSYQEQNYGRRAFFGRIPLGDRLHLVVDGGARHVGSTRRFPSRDYYDVSVGMGADVRLSGNEGRAIVASGRASQLASLDASNDSYDKRQGTVIAALGVQQRASIRHVHASLWLAPAYVRETVVQYAPRQRASRIYT